MIVRSFIAVVTFSALAAPALAQEACSLPDGKNVSARIFSITGGDSLRIRNGNGDRGDGIRLWGIDAPTRRMPYWMESASALADRGGYVKCFVRYHNNDRLCVATCTFDVDLAEAQLRDGWAKVRRRQINEDLKLKARYDAAEQEARTAKRGLWAK